MEEQQHSEVSFVTEEDVYEYDAIVVGSGYGGSVAACRMSMAGINVCLLEKGKRWEALDFPTNSLEIMSAVRMENRDLGISLGHKDALFQVYEQNDCLAAVACGLGGGSLVNAGVMVPTPVRARKDPKWPKEWEGDWDHCESSAAAMLRIQSIPVKFSMTKVIEKVINGDMEENPIKLSMNFDLEDLPTRSAKSQQTSSCLGCGNCLSGCPYNAKNSTDKNYLLSAIQAGCVVQTECQVKYIIKNPSENYHERGSKSRRRWLVYLNEMDYISADFVILSAGVLGTTEILFQSQSRGLKLSETLGCGFSSNGNNVAYLAGSRAPLMAYGLDQKEIARTPFQERPGTSISSSYTSSLGFTIQSAVLPVAYPYLLFKGIATYGWPSGHWFFHGIIDKLKHILGFESSQAVILNTMGYDQSDGKISFEKSSGKVNFSPPYDPLLPKKVEALKKITKKLGGILFMSKYRSTSVHLLGGCNASWSCSHGVCSHSGQVFDPDTGSAVHLGLYVCDASLVPSSVGINPSLTIATAAEHVSRHLVRDVLEYNNFKKSRKYDVEPVDRHMDLFTKQQSMVVFKETMRGYLGGMPCTAHLKIRMTDPHNLNLVVGKSYSLLRGKVGGHLVFRAIEKENIHIIDGEVNLCNSDCKTPYTQYMSYSLLLAASSGSRYTLEGQKILNPSLFALCAWRETTTMHVTLKKIGTGNSRDGMVHMKGKLKISMIELLKTLLSLEGNSRGLFLWLFSKSLLRTYILQIPRVKQDLSSDINHKPYRSSSFHEIKTEDGCIISFRKWRAIENPWKPKEGKLYPVLLLNGFSTESFWLPTEPNDLVRTLLEEGHEIWLLQSRLHPQNPSANCTIEDIGKFDIPAAIGMIMDLHGKSIKVHVVAHCVGGLAIHIALMGGHISASRIASLSCTNSSMFFKLNLLATVKMFLPLIPISLAILGKDKILPLLETSKASTRHQIVKSIARLIPRHERCTCKECEVISGIFGNAFWHTNVSATMHHWLNKESSSKIPLAPFSHVRKISKSGFIVDSNGNNTFLIHPERMQLPTLYISGGRTIIVTPETSFLANQYMKLHQPGFRHERVVVEGFGHSDLLIGEESYKVFSHILSHIRLAEESKQVMPKCEAKNYNNEAVLDWESDPYDEGYERSECWVSLLFFVFVFVFLFFIYLFGEFFFI